MSEYDKESDLAAKLRDLANPTSEPVQNIEVKQEVSTEISSEAAQEPKISEVAPEISDLEKKARALGWKSKEEREAEGKDNAHFVEYDEYVRRQPLFERIDKQKREMQELKDLVKQSAEHLANMRKEAYGRALQDLEQQKMKVVESGDVDSYRNLDNQVQGMKQQMDKDPIIHPTQPPKLPPEVIVFGEKNKNWFNETTVENKKMKAAAEAVDHYLTQQANIDGRQINVPEHLATIEAEVKRLFPHRFENAKREAPTTVAKSTTTRVSTDKNTVIHKLTDQQRKMGQYFERTTQGKYTLEMYAKDLELSGQIKSN